jgi:hypothetical protein
VHKVTDLNDLERLSICASIAYIKLLPASISGQVMLHQSQPSFSSDLIESLLSVLSTRQAKTKSSTDNVNPFGGDVRGEGVSVDPCLWANMKLAGTT